MTIQQRKFRQNVNKSLISKFIICLIFSIASNSAFSQFIIDCTTTKIIESGAGVQPQPVGSKFRFSLSNGQAWSDPFFQSLLFTMTKNEKTAEGIIHGSFSAKGFNMPEARISLTLNGNLIQLNARQANTEIASDCVNVTKQVLQTRAETARKSEIEEFSLEQMQSGLGWYISRTGNTGFYVDGEMENFRNLYVNEPRVAVMKRLNRNESSDHFIMIGPFPSQGAAQADLPRIQSDIPYANVIKIGQKQLSGDSYVDDVHVIVTRNFR